MKKTCEKCLQTFSCGTDQAGSACWCMELPVVKGIPGTYSDCLCPNCLQKFAEPSNSDVNEAIDSYIDENQNLVFTEAYHLKRGYCCQNGCRHCPY